MTRRVITNKKGVALIAAVATLLILSLAGVVIVSLVGKESYSVLNQGQPLQASSLAEAGAHRALTYISNECGACTAITGAPEFTNVALSRGTFTVTGTRYNPASTTLSGAIGDTTPRFRLTVPPAMLPMGEYLSTRSRSITRAPRPTALPAPAGAPTIPRRPPTPVEPRSIKINAPSAPPELSVGAWGMPSGWWKCLRL